jgi:hypothetical protein
MDNSNHEPRIIEQESVLLKPPKSRKGHPAPEMVVFEREGLLIGRNKVPVPPEEVEKLAAMGCTNRDIAHWFGVAEDNIRRHFADQIIKGREGLKQSLRQAQIKLALTGNAVMLIWLGKNILGQTDTPNNSEDKKPLPWESTDE